jgi:RNA polymerase sigma-70 factor, ECF subfamily
MTMVMARDVRTEGAPIVLAPVSERPADRLRNMIDAHIDAMARVLRRLGVPEADVDDGVQQVFLTASRRMDDIETHAEKAFLYRIALHVAMHARRTMARRREDTRAEIPLVDGGPNAEEMLDRKRAAILLEQILEGMPEELRVIFVLFEVEQFSVVEIASLIDLPEGTTASRLRRAREDFRERVARIKARRGLVRAGQDKGNK